MMVLLWLRHVTQGVPNSLTPACKPGVGGNVSNQSELYVILLPYSKWGTEREEERERERETHTHTHTYTEAENSGVRRKENGSESDPLVHHPMDAHYDHQLCMNLN